MTNKLNVLVLDDRPEDAELVAAELRRAGFDLEWKWVDCEDEYLDCLDDNFDIILADYSMPGFGALPALRLLNEQGLDIPFVVVTVTFTPKTVPYEVLDFQDDFGPIRKGSSDEEIKVYGRADRLRPAAGGEWHASEWCVPEDGHIGEYVLPMEKKVRRYGGC